MDKDILRKRIDVAAGRALADIVIKKGKVVDVYSGIIKEADVAIADGIIVGIGDYDGREIIYAYYFMYSFSDLVGINVFCVLAKRILSYKYCLLLNNEEGNTYQLFLKDCTTTSNNPACKCCNQESSGKYVSCFSVSDGAENRENDYLRGKYNQ